MKASCVCCQALEAKASGVSATLVLLFTLAGDKIAPANIIEALCEDHAARLDSMIYRSLVPPHAKSALRKGIVGRLPLIPPSTRKRAKQR